MSGLRKYIEDRPQLKARLFKLMMPGIRARPRWWVRWFINPFVHKVHRKAFVSRKARLDVIPSKDFVVGAGSLIEDYAVINNGVGPVILGKECIIGIHTVVIGPVELEDGAIMAQNVVVSALNHNYESTGELIKNQGVRTFPVKISKGAWIGANTVITAGITIGEHAIVGAGSVVTKHVPPYSLVAGNPAKIIKQYNQETKKWERV